MKKIIKCFVGVISVMFLFCACGTSNKYLEYSQVTDNINTLDSNDKKLSQADSNKGTDSMMQKKLTVTNGYRFKNTVDDVRLVFEEIYLISEWNGIKPHNDSFLVMKVTASSDTPNDTGIFNLPHTIVASDGTEYESINSNFKYNYKNSAGETIDIATEINANYVTKQEGKISAYNVNFISRGGNGIRYIVFDISQKVALDPASYLIFFGTEEERFENEVSSLNVYFSDYVIVKK